MSGSLTVTEPISHSHRAPVIDGENDTAVILCSSGTTGPPKAICLSHSILLERIPIAFDVITSDAVGLTFSTLYWIGGITMLIIGILSSATRLITTEKFSSELMLQMIERYKVTFLLSAPYQVMLALKSTAIDTTDLSSVNFWVAGGCKVPLDACIKMSEYTPNVHVSAGFGLTELGGYFAINHPFVERDCVGTLKSGSQIKIVDDRGKRLGVGESGEICVKMNFKFGGYYGNKEATDALFDEEGFLQTADIGHIDADGLLYITDRKKDFLKYCNYMISPSEIEDFLIACPGVAAVCIVGIPDRIAGDLPAALIVRTKNSTITEKEINNMIAGNFADSRKLRGGIYFVDSLPSTASGKRQRQKVQVIANHLYSVKQG